MSSYVCERSKLTNLPAGKNALLQVKSDPHFSFSFERFQRCCRKQTQTRGPRHAAPSAEDYFQIFQEGLWEHAFNTTGRCATSDQVAHTESHCYATTSSHYSVIGSYHTLHSWRRTQTQAQARSGPKISSRHSVPLFQLTHFKILLRNPFTFYGRRRFGAAGIQGGVGWLCFEIDHLFQGFDYVSAIPNMFKKLL